MSGLSSAFLAGVPPPRRPSTVCSHMAKHSGSRPAVDLQAVLLLIGAERRARLHAGLAVDLVLIEALRGQRLLHRLDIGGAHDRGLAPRRLKPAGIADAVAHMPDEQHVKVGEIVLL